MSKFQVNHASPFQWPGTLSKTGVHKKAIRFGSQEVTPKLTREQRGQLERYLRLMEKPIPTASAPVVPLHELLKSDLWALTLPQLRQVLATRSMHEFPPAGTRPGRMPQPAMSLPFQFPDLRALFYSQPGRLFSYEIPVKLGSSLEIKQPDTSPYLDLSSGSDASQMLRAGLQPYEIAESYGVKWSPQKTCRDILQNFFDSHGQTMEGVKIEAEVLPLHHSEISARQDDNKPDSSEDFPRIPRQRFRVRIDGLGQYNYEKAFYLGEGGKLDDPTSAGGYGEGLKITALNLLRDFQTESVKMASADWSLTYTLPPGNNELSYELKQVPEADRPKGSSLEFVTEDSFLVRDLFKAVNYFYHSYNPDFQEATYENDIGGLKLLGPKAAGHPYIARQRYEGIKAGRWERSLAGMALWLNQKMPNRQVDRDRSPVSASDISNMEDLIIESMTIPDKIALLQILSPFWTSRDLHRSFYAAKTMVLMLCRSLYRKEHITLAFPPKYIADDLHRIASVLKLSVNKAKQKLKKEGYIFCEEEFNKLGMITSSELLYQEKQEYLKEDLKTKTTGENPVSMEELTPAEKARFNILADVVRALGGVISSHGDLDRLRYKNYCYKNPGARPSDQELDIPYQALSETSFNKALSSVLFHYLKKEHSVYTAKYSYILTDFCGDLLSILAGSNFISDPQNFFKLRQLWALSFKPELTPKNLKAFLEETKPRPTSYPTDHFSPYESPNSRFYPERTGYRW